MTLKKFPNLVSASSRVKEGPMLPSAISLWAFLHMAIAISSPPWRDIKRVRLIASVLLFFDVFKNSSLVTFWASTCGRKNGDSKALPVIVMPVAQRRGTALSSKLVRSWRASMRPRSNFSPNFLKAGPLRDFSSASRLRTPESCLRALTDSRISNLAWLAFFWDLVHSRPFKCISFRPSCLSKGWLSLRATFRWS